MNKKYLPTILAITVLILGPISAYAWTAAPASPPSGNVSEPLNVGPTSQTKLKGLILNSGNAEYGLLVPYGKVGIGSLTPSGLFEVFGNAVSLFKVLVDGTVGVGIATPPSRLSVAGGVQVGDDTAPCTVAKAGTMRWSNSSGTYRLEVCGSATSGGVVTPGWTVVSGGTTPGNNTITGYTARPGEMYGVCKATHQNTTRFGGVTDSCNQANGLTRCDNTTASKCGCYSGSTINSLSSATTYYQNGQLQITENISTCVCATVGGCVWPPTNITSPASCPAQGGCPLTVSGGTCNSSPNATSNFCSSEKVTSLCINGNWNNPPAAYPTCTSALAQACASSYYTELNFPESQTPYFWCQTSGNGGTCASVPSASEPCGCSSGTREVIGGSYTAGTGGTSAIQSTSYGCR
ncbi:MAG: hypothetical protein NT077_01750 [Candidatus Taylorbacteria bacterium]|nr:hypothetical protein [Candidatus Taylorbacteria bacterium]